MNAVIFAFSGQGRVTARRISAALDGAAQVMVPPRLADDACAPYGESLAAYVGSVFDRDALIFVGACGIALRSVAPHVADKRSDPAVLCVDEKARFVIPLLSGHIGGANRLSKQLAEALGATPVITTATDVNGRFAVDAWAAERGIAITDMALAKRVSAAILTDDIPFCADGLDPRTPLPAGLVRGASGALGICVSVRDKRPFDATLLLVPRALRVGVGCRRGTPASVIDALIDRVLRENQLRPEAVAEAASIDFKRGEPGLNAACRSRGWLLVCYTAEALSAVPGAFSDSGFVRDTVGVGNVCERAAMAAGGTLIVPKTAENGVTVAVAALEWRVDFD